VCISLFASAQQVWSPLLQTMANKRLYNEMYEFKIKELNRALKSYEANEYRCDKFIDEKIIPDYKKDMEKKEKETAEWRAAAGEWKARCLECEKKLEK
jgi:hypothetical protein